MLVNRSQLIEAIKSGYPFNHLPPDDINHLAETSDVVFFKAGSMIFLEGASSPYLYLIYEGEIEILKEKNQQILKLNYLPAGYVFGEDGLIHNGVRRTGARAVKDAILVKIPKKSIDQIMTSDRDFSRAANLLIHSYEILIEKIHHQSSKDESILFLGRPHQFHFISRFFLIFLWLLVSGLAVLYLSERFNFFKANILWIYSFIFVASVLMTTWSYLEWRNDIFIFTSKRIICMDRIFLFHDVRFETPLNSITNLNIRKNIVGRGLDFGDLFVKTFTGESRLKHMPMVESAARLLDFECRREKKTLRQQEQLDFQRLVDEPSQYEQEVLLGKPFLEPDHGHISSSENASLINKLFKLRLVEGDTVIYHTHWIKLVRKVFFPSAILISIVLLQIYFSLNNIGLGSNRLFQISTLFITAVCVVWWIYQFLDWRRDQYIISTDQIMDVDKKPFGNEDMRTAPIKNIQSIRYKRKGLIGLILNFGTVYIRVGDEELTFDNVPDPAAVQQELFWALERNLFSQKRADLTEQQRHVADWIASYLENKKNTQVSDYE